MKAIKHKKPTIILGAALLVVIAAASAYYFIALKAPTSNTQSNTNKTCTTYGGKLPKTCIEDYIGLTYDKAEAKARQLGYKLYDPDPRSGIGASVYPAIRVHLNKESDTGVVTSASFDGY